jgi:RNA polymerase sigma factor (sigma-70 family)
MLMKHLGKLSKKQHDVIRARYWGNLSYKQIAEQFKLSVENVGFILSKSIKKLRMRMNAEDSLENLLISLM